ncbi:hypothetical protein EV184_1491, partial [Sinorhizobium americanum]
GRRFKSCPRNQITSNIKGSEILGALFAFLPRATQAIKQIRRTSHRPASLAPIDGCGLPEPIRERNISNGEY